MLIVAVALVARFSDNALLGFSDVLLNLGVAAAAWAGGWWAGSLALVAAPLALSLWSHVTFQRSLSEWVECLIILAVVALARGGIARFRRSENKLRALLSSMDERILVFDRDGTFVEVVETKAPLVYLPSENRIGRKIADFMTPAESAASVASIRKALEERRTVQHDYALPIEGRTVWFSASVSPLNSSLVLWVARDITARKLANDELESRVEQRTRELKATETRYRGIVEQANDIIFTLTSDREITSLNPAFTRLTGYAAGDWLARDFVDLIAPDHRPHAAQQFARALATGSLEFTMATICDAEGRRLVLEASLSPQIINGENVGFLGCARDVTKRERDDVERRRNEEQLADSQRIAKLGSWEMDLASGRLWWSDETYRIFGMERTDRPLMFTDFRERVAPDDQPRLAGIDAELLASGSHDWELRIVTPAGAEKTISCSARFAQDEHGHRRIFGTNQDITEKKHAEQLLRDSEERFRLLARATSDAIWDHDAETGAVWRGEGYETLFGYAPGTIGTNVEAFRELVHPDDLPQLSASYTEALESGQLSFTHEYRFRRADGSYANILDRGYIVRDREKRPVRILGAMIDLTERKQMAEQLEQTKRLSSLGRLAGSIAHEFNNVLMGVQANAEIIGGRAAIELRPVVANVIGAVRRGRRITEEILRYMRPAEPAPQSLNVQRLLDEWANEIRPTLGGRVDLRVDVESDELCIRADPQQIAQVFTNMAFNSRDAIPDPGGTLSVHAEIATSYSTFAFGVVKTPDRFVHFRVADNGAGIGAEQLAHVFEPLYTTKRDGTGLGLAVSYQIVTRSDGHIFVESEPGAGTTFHIFLPLCCAEEMPAAPETVPMAVLGRVLLVEDEPEVAAGVAMLLEVEGAEVHVVHSGAETAPAIERFAPDVVILDIGLPDIDGIQVYERIARRWPDLRVLFSSGHAQARNLERWLARPNVALLVKPYEMSELRSALGRLLEVAPASPTIAT
jgi:PAS domain S-box-containing protein